MKLTIRLFCMAIICRTKINASQNENRHKTLDACWMLKSAQNNHLCYGFDNLFVFPVLWFHIDDDWQFDKLQFRLFVSERERERFFGFNYFECDSSKWLLLNIPQSYTKLNDFMTQNIYHSNCACFSKRTQISTWGIVWHWRDWT